MARANTARWPHVAPLVGLLSLDLVMLRHVFLSHGLPVGGDSGFLYSALPYFARHGLGTFSVWLPSPLGEVQQYSLYWALGSVVSIVGNPVEVYKLAMLAVIALTSVIMYGFAYWLTRDRFAAAIASFAYSFAPFAVAQWLDGHMNVQVSYAVGPATIWALWLALRSGGRRPMVVLGLAEAALFLLTTGQGAYWVLGLVVVVFWEIVTSEGRWRVACRLGITAVVSGATFIAASAVQLVPYALGAKAPFVGGGAAYYIEQLSVHRKYSLSFLDGVVGTPRELYLLPGTTIGAPGFAGWQLQALGIVLVGIAFASLATRAWRYSVPLGVLVLMAWLLAAGPAGPAGSLYVDIYNHVPVIRFLRVPNRWLMVSSMGIALMLAVTLAAARQLSRSARTKFVRRLFRRMALLAIAIVALSGTYAFAPGLKTWNPPALYGSAFTPLSGEKGNWRILTTPLFQSWMDGQGPTGNGETFVADLGYTSSYWHEHAVLGRGGWDPRAARFSKYLYELVRQGTTTSIAPLLAAIDVKYVSLDPQPAIESVLHQNAFFRRQAGLTPTSTSGPITLLRTENTAPSAFVSAKRCVVAGGLSTLGDLAATRLIDLQTTMVVFADQLVATGGRSELARQLMESRCLILAPGGYAALRILLTSVAAQSISSVSPASWLRSETSPIEDVAADPTTEVSVPGRSIISFSFTVPRTGRYRVWLNALRDQAQRGVAIRVDSDTTSRIGLRSSFGSGYRWNATRPLALTAGTHTSR